MKCLLASLALLQAASAFEVTCDDIVENKCELEVTEGWITIRDFNLKYWVYEPVGIEVTKDTFLAAHGGPGSSHLYMDPLKYMACKGRKVVMWDQLGAGESDWPTVELNPWIYTVEYYREEIYALIKELDIKGYHLLGHSWGGIIAQDYAITHASKFATQRDPNLRSVVLASIFVNAESYMPGQWKHLFAKLPPYTRKLIKKAMDEERYDDPALQIITDHLGTYYSTRTSPVPTCASESELPELFNHKLYVDMQGPSEFANGGVLEKWDASEKFQTVDIPVLATLGEFDTMSKSVEEDLRKNCPDGTKVVVFPSSGHSTMIDQPDMSIDVLEEFFSQVEMTQRYREFQEAQESATSDEIERRRI